MANPLYPKIDVDPDLAESVLKEIRGRECDLQVVKTTEIRSPLLVITVREGQEPGSDDDWEKFKAEIRKQLDGVGMQHVKFIALQGVDVTVVGG